MSSLSRLSRHTSGPRQVGAVGLTAVVALAAAGCSGGEQSSGTGSATQYATAGTLTVALGQDPGALDPHLTALSGTRTVASFAYDSLIYSDADGKAVSGLAEKWDVAGNKVTYTLRDGVTCADGSPLTATDVAANFSFVADPKNASPRLGLEVPPGVEATADDTARTVTLSSATPVPFLLETTGGLLIVCKKGLSDRATLTQQTQGTGPFVLGEVVANDRYTFTRRQGYGWGPAGARSDEQGVPEKVVVRVVGNAATAVNLLLSGEVQFAEAGDADVARAKAANLKSAGLEAPFGELWFNQAPGHPGADQGVRQALVGALDEQEIGTVLTGGLGVPAKGLTTLEPRVCDGDTVTGNLPAMTVEEAGAMLDEAGWVRGADGVRSKNGKPLAFTFVAPTSLGDNGTPGAELLAQTWKELGATVKLSSQPDTALQGVLFQSGDWDAGFVPLGVVLPTQYAGFVSGPTPPAGTNFAHIDNPTYEAAAAKAASATGDQVCAQYEEAEKALIREADVAPLVNKETLYFANGAEFRLGRAGLVVQSLRRLAP